MFIQRLFSQMLSEELSGYTNISLLTRGQGHKLCTTWLCKGKVDPGIQGMRSQGILIPNTWEVKEPGDQKDTFQGQRQSLEKEVLTEVSAPRFGPETLKARTKALTQGSEIARRQTHRTVSQGYFLRGWDYRSRPFDLPHVVDSSSESEHKAKTSLGTNIEIRNIYWVGKHSLIYAQGRHH